MDLCYRLVTKYGFLWSYYDVLFACRQLKRIKHFLSDNDTDGAAYINSGLELAGVVGPVRWARSIYNLHRKGDPAGECRLCLRFLSQFLSYERERDQWLMVL